MKTFSFSAAVLVLWASAVSAAAPMDDAIVDITHMWAKVTYDTPPERQADGYRGLVAATERTEQAYPGKAEPMIWHAIALSSAARVEGGLGALGKVKQARDLLLGAEKIDPGALSGSIYGSLGSLYAKVPGWPIGFGDKNKAADCFKRALAINPNGIDPNYFYAEFLADEGRYPQALTHLQRALAAPARAGREDSDAGRRREAQSLLDSLRKNHGDEMGAP